MYKSTICVELDKKFGGVHLEILEIEIHVLAKLSAYVTGKKELLKKPLKLLSLFDRYLDGLLLEQRYV